MGLACDCSCDEAEPCAVFVRARRTARRVHQCCECGNVVKPGETYEHTRSLFDGRWATAKTCAICARIRDDFCPRGYVVGALRETLWECLGLDYIDGSENPRWEPRVAPPPWPFPSVED